MNKQLHEIIETTAESLDENSRIEIVIESGYAGITLFHNNEKIGDYDCGEDIETMDELLDYVLGREKHLHD